MKGFSLGKILGIEIRIDWSWLLIFGLVSWGLYSSFGSLRPDWSSGTRALTALLGGLLFFVSVLAHELAHSLVARARGVPVHNITLFLFGGVSNIQREPASPGAELLVAIVGPLTSFIIGGICLALVGGTLLLHNIPNVMEGLSRLSPPNTLLLWLGSVNILLGLFNMVPGFPLDGGRVLRSILWMLTGDMHKATRWAAWAGQAVAWGLMLAGGAMLFGAQLPLLGGGVFNGMWSIFIGWFLQSAAAQSYHRAVIQDVMEDVPVKKLMYTEVPSAPAGISVNSLLDEHMLQSGRGAFIVFDEDRMVGLVTIEDVRKLPPEKRATTKVRDIMTPSEKLIVTAPEEKVSEALNRLEDQDVRQLPVVNGNNIVGMLRRKDIQRWLELQSHAR